MAEQGEAAHQAQGRADRADGVAVFPAPEPGADGDDHQRQQARDQQRRDDRSGGRARDAADNPSVGAVRGDQGYQHLAAYDNRHDRQGQHAVAHALVLLDVGEAFEMVLDLGQRAACRLDALHAARLGILLPFSEGAADPDDDVLEYAHRADDRAVDASEEEIGQQDDGDHDEIQGQAGRQELEFRHPAPPAVADAQEEQRDSDQEQGRQGDAEFT